MKAPGNAAACAERVVSGAESYLMGDAGDPPADEGDTDPGSPLACAFYSSQDPSSDPRNRYFFSFFFFLAALRLHCCVWAFFSCSERGLFFVAVRRLLIAVASLAAEHGL